MRRARRLPGRARTPRELRPADAAAGRSSRPTTTSTSASSGSRPAWCRRRRPKPRARRTATPSRTRRWSTSRPQRRSRSRPRPRRRSTLGIQREVAVLRWNGERHEIDEAPRRARPLEGRRPAGRRPERLAPPRRAAPGGRDVLAVDLDSTNGVEVRGKRVKRLKLEDGTRFTIGSTEIAFSRELQ